MRNSKRLVLLQAVAILIAVFQYGMRAAGQDEGRNSNRILSNPYLTIRYAKTPLESYYRCVTIHNCMELIEAHFSSRIRLYEL